jgi:Protein tyrosine and serine/threonine kinase
MLGSGAYGCVLKGVLTLENGSKRNVAIKTTKPNADVMYFKALLAEVKMMSFLGPHINIVNLLGAVTKEIRLREKIVCRIKNSP